MSQNDDLFTYDEDDAVKYIQNVLPQELKEKYSYDDIVYITDVVYDYYEQKGLFDERDEEEVELDEDDIIAYARKCARKDGVTGKQEWFYCWGSHRFFPPRWLRRIFFRRQPTRFRRGSRPTRRRPMYRPNISTLPN